MALAKGFLVSITMASDNIVLIRDWLKKSKHLPQDVDDYAIQCFILAAKHSAQNAKQRLEAFYMLRHMFEYEYLINWDPLSDNFNPMTSRMMIVKLPKTMPKGHHIFFVAGKHNISTADFSVKACQLIYFFVTVLLWSHEAPEEVVICVDYKNMTAADGQTVTPRLAYQFSKAFKSAQPTRIKAIYLLNVSRIIETVINIFKRVIGEKLRSRIIVLPQIDSLYEHIPREILPVNYGGNDGDIFKLSEMTFMPLLHKYRDRFIRQQSEVHAERPFVPSHLQSSAHDTFRTLEID